LVFTVLQLSAFARVKVAATARLRPAFGGKMERRLILQLLLRRRPKPLVLRRKLAVGDVSVIVLFVFASPLPVQKQCVYRQPGICNYSLALERGVVPS
jgi:hypothetical protein